MHAFFDAAADRRTFFCSRGLHGMGMEINVSDVEMMHLHLFYSTGSMDLS